ncbi:caspase family protein [Phaeobacter inhibens]|uniref:caspase family protein n=1 Tax=Phaeobacter inhibens TaxID=221822 RepID=UPI0021A83C01|nr:caspase family protein [Phaeobacter inhibens]UWR91708.1 caspase family protein [Phaeobacter inhibens]
MAQSRLRSSHKEAPPEPLLSNGPTRRTVLAGGGATLLGGLAMRAARAQVDPSRLRRAAVVIGVDRTNRLPPLNGAASGARDMERFLLREGFDPVVPLIDDGGKDVVTVDVFNAVAALVAPGNLDQLVIYFSGHGFMHGYSDHWILSGAPYNPGETVVVKESAELARFCGIPNVVFISDACRVPTTNTALERIAGGYKIFPASGTYLRNKVDFFFGTAPGKPAFETAEESAANHKGVFTEAFLHTFRAPWDDMIVTLDSGQEIIPNRRMEKFILSETQVRAEEANITLQQEPQIDVVTQDDHVFIGRHIPMSLGPGRPGPSPPPEIVPARRFVRSALSEIAEFTASDAMANQNGKLYPPRRAANGVFAVAQAEEQIYLRALRDRADPFFAAPGVTVEGAGIASVTAPAGVALGTPEPLDMGRTAVAAVLNAARAATILLTLESGAALPLAVLRDQAAHVTVEGDAVVDIRYTPLAGTERAEVFQANRDEIETLRSAVGAAVVESTFLFGGSAERNSAEDPAESLGARFAELAPFDPTLALYAAYALDAAQRDALVASVAKTNAEALGVQLFDLALLSGRGPNGLRLPDGLVPFCPAFRPGWSVVRAHDIPQPAPVRAAMPFLTDSPWSVFAPEGARILKTAIENGELP